MRPRPPSGNTLNTTRLLLLFALALGLGCTLFPQQTDCPPDDKRSYLLVMSAFPPELSRHLDNIELADTCVVAGSACYIGRLAGNEVILTLGGIGLERAEASTRALLDTFEITGIVFSGIAGGVNPGLKIGDVTVSARWGWADGDLGPADEGFWFAVDPGMLEVAGEISGDVSLNRCTPDSICLDRTPVVVTGGNGVSNSFFVDDARYRRWLWDTFQANAVDMETSAVIRVATERGVPFIAFRSLSDLAGGGPGENEIGIFFQLAADNAAAVVTAFLKSWRTVRTDTLENRGGRP